MTNYRICLFVVLTAACFNFGKAVGQPSRTSRAVLKVEQKSFGQMPDGWNVTLYELTNVKGLRARVIDYGAILVSLEVPDRDGKLADVALGFDDLDSYIKRNPLFGATVGRYVGTGKCLESTDDAEHQVEKEGRRQHRQRDPPEGRPYARPINSCCFIQLPWNALEAG